MPLIFRVPTMPENILQDDTYHTTKKEKLQDSLCILQFFVENFRECLFRCILLLCQSILLEDGRRKLLVYEVGKPDAAGFRRLLHELGIPHILKNAHGI